MTILYIVATPIGNLKDITLRALEILKSVDLILCEDTRVTKKLLLKYEIEKPLWSYHQHSRLNKIEQIISELSSGKNIALVSDAGTPGISDPGGILIQAVYEKLGEDVKIVPIPGPNAAISALSISGFPADNFHFLGFPPNKKGRKTFFGKTGQIKETIVFYESKYRIEKTLLELEKSIGNRQIIVCRELTKQFETIYRGLAKECLDALRKDKILGEFVIVIRAVK